MARAQASFEVFFEDTHRRLFGALCLVTGNRQEAEEFMQKGVTPDGPIAWNTVR